MTDEIIKEDTSIHKQLTNIGAWFSSDMTSSNYILVESNAASFNIVTVFRFRNENYCKALQMLCEQLEKYGSITSIVYNHKLDRFEFTLFNDKYNFLYLESIDKYVEEI